MAHSNSRTISSHTAKLTQDLATLVNNRQGSDIQFKVGGSCTPQENDETNYGESDTVTLYAHSLILRCRSRYFAAMLDEDKHWKESANGVIYKPNISPSTFQDILHYIYTGNVCAKSSENIIELITAADEMDLEELSTECQTELVRTIKYIFSDEDDSDDENESRKIVEELTMQRIPIDVAIRTHIIPVLNLASGHPLSHLSQKLQAVILPHMSVIVKSPNAYITFTNEISFEALSKIIASNNLAITERNVWDLVLDWACHQTKLSKPAVEARLSNAEDDEDDEEDEENDDEELSSGTKISSSQLNQLKKILAPLLPAIRFSLFEPDDYAQMVYTISYFLSRRRSLELQRYFIRTNRTKQLDTPRMKYIQRKKSSKIINSMTWEFLRKNIFETAGIAGCPSLKHLKFELLFRASEHGFLASTFHQHCDNKGPTLVLIRSSDSHIFGGANFNDWKSDNTWSFSLLNFLFTLPDGRHRNDSVVFRINQISAQSSGNYATYGPILGCNDLYIANSANIYSSGSTFPKSFNGNGVSNTTLAGSEGFTVSDYEVFAISK